MTAAVYSTNDDVLAGDPIGVTRCRSRARARTSTGPVFVDHRRRSATSTGPAGPTRRRTRHTPTAPMSRVGSALFSRDGTSPRAGPTGRTVTSGLCQVTAICPMMRPASSASPSTMNSSSSGLRLPAASIVKVSDFIVGPARGRIEVARIDGHSATSTSLTATPSRAETGPVMSTIIVAPGEAPARLARM